MDHFELTEAREHRLQVRTQIHERRTQAVEGGRPVERVQDTTRRLIHHDGAATAHWVEQDVVIGVERQLDDLPATDPPTRTRSHGRLDDRTVAGRRQANRTRAILAAMDQKPFTATHVGA
jgi:hypothetical protein